MWLIVFGAIFLVANAGIFHGFSGRLFVPFFLIGLAVFVFVKKMTAYGSGLANDGTAVLPGTLRAGLARVGMAGSRRPAFFP